MKSIAEEHLPFSYVPKHTLAAVERLDTPTGSSTDTTTDTGPFVQPVSAEVLLH